MSRNPAPGGHAHRSISWIWLAALAGSPSPAEPPKPPSAAQLIESLANPDFYERQRAMDGLAAHRAASESLAPALREKLRAKDQEVRQRAAMALAALGVGEAPVIDELQEALNDPAAAEEAARSLKVIEVARRQPRASPLLTRGVTPGRTAAGESGAGASLRPPPTGLEVGSHLGGASRLCRDRNRQK